MTRAQLTVIRLHESAKVGDPAALTAFELACNGLDMQEVLAELSARFVDVVGGVTDLLDTIERLDALTGNTTPP